MQSIPVTILGGSDLEPGALPESGDGLHALSAYKGVALRIDGRPLIELLVERLVATPGFGPVAVAGPARQYGPLGLDARIVETDGSVAANLRAAIEATAGGSGPVGIMACDVLPTVEELAAMRAEFEAARPCSLWLPFVATPEDERELGAFAWKPTYRLVPPGGSAAVRILPGHLGIFDPAALRLPLLYRLLDAAYRTRNRPVAYRRAVMLRMVLLSILGQDLKLLLGLRWPTRTWTIVGSGLRLARELRRGPLALEELERIIARIFLRAHTPHERGVRLPIVDVVSLAADIDTEEEALELERRNESARPG